MSDYDRLRARYESGDLPWDSPLPPPEVMTLVETMPPGRALDLGCGYGRAAIYLAGHGWSVDAVDFVELAIAEARRRAARAKAAVNFHLRPVSDLSSFEPPYDLAVDVGCFHGLDAAERADYAGHLVRLLAAGAAYILFARLRAPDEPPGEEGPRGVTDETIRATFDPGFELTRFERGETGAPDGPSWASGWFWYRRRRAL